ncbi:putative RNA pseudouridine synthase [Candidatus Desulfarcum epimagneticum]|uniref:Pseudouridine synthase n=1 Tax=uncultured Desulfobacteraceae bacterium TaxID=218296 RepID=A0A484HDW0_9BACT|nr:putative RNA pseudouridine synthase [uncultured Desulfobacteraceae bacterium]
MSPNDSLNILESFHIKIGPSDSGKRLDLAVCEAGIGVSRSFASALIKNGNITLNGGVAKSGRRVREGDHIRIHVPAPDVPVFHPEPIPIDVMYEDDDILAIQKPAGMVTHPAPGHPSGTLANALLHRFPGIFNIGGARRPGIVHRLDKDTSGVMVAAKNSLAHEGLSRQFKEREVKKTYLALALHEVKTASGEISLPIGRHPVDRKKMSVVSRRPRKALTLWKVREIFPGLSLLEVDLKTGRTHQIRVHCAAMGHPVAGDLTYGGRIGKKGVPGMPRFERQMLHAWRISLKHPRSMRPLFFESSMPPDMAGAVSELRKRKQNALEKI